jgi:hypothetical protein
VKRRTAAIAASFFLLGLNVVGLDRACGTSHADQPASQDHAGHDNHHAPAPEPQHDEPAKCCDALSVCGMTLSFGSEVVSADPSFDGAVQMRFAHRVPGSEPSAPEPPPPRI